LQGRDVFSNNRNLISPGDENLGLRYEAFIKTSVVYYNEDSCVNILISYIA
jgi:hypothetical protein